LSRYVEKRLTNAVSAASGGRAAGGSDALCDSIQARAASGSVE
jgi:hypothetical protein